MEHDKLVTYLCQQKHLPGKKNILKTREKQGAKKHETKFKRDEEKKWDPAQQKKTDQRAKFSPNPKTVGPSLGDKPYNHDGQESWDKYSKTIFEGGQIKSKGRKPGASFRIPKCKQKPGEGQLFPTPVPSKNSPPDPTYPKNKPKKKDHLKV